MKPKKVLGALASRRQKQWNQHEFFEKKRNKDFLRLHQMSSTMENNSELAVPLW